MYKVMLVDNEATILEGLTNIINWQQLDCSIAAQAHNGQEALEIQQKAPVDIIVTDIRMPVMDGLELCKRMQTLDPHVQTIIITGFPDFEYAKKAISYSVCDFILKPTDPETLTAAVQKAIKILKAQQGSQKAQDNYLQLKQMAVLNELLLNQQHSTIYYIHKLAEAEILLDSYYVLSLGFPDSVDFSSLDKQIADIRSAIQNKWSVTEHYLRPGDNRYYDILCTDDVSLIGKISSEIVLEVDNDSNYSVTIGISNFHSSAFDLLAASTEADEARQFAAIYSNHTPVMYYANLPRIDSATQEELLKRCRYVETALDNHSEEMLQKNMDLLFQYMSEQNLSYFSMSQIAKLLYHYGHNMLNSYLFYDSSVYKFQGATKAFNEDAEKLRDYITDYLLGVLQQIKQSAGSDDSIIQSICSYINLNLADDLSLNQLAEKSHLSTSYFSRLFKKKVGVNLSSYILTRRIAMAQKLLLTTDKKIYEIGEAIGINDPVYFSRIFKKETGQKPKEYREAPNGLSK